MPKPLQFPWRHYQPEIILCCGRWYCRYPLSYAQAEEWITERGLPVDHSTVFRWVQHYSPDLDKRCPSGSQSPTEGNPPAALFHRPHLRLTNDSWRVGQTYIEVKGQGKYLSGCGYGRQHAGLFAYC